MAAGVAPSMVASAAVLPEVNAPMKAGMDAAGTPSCKRASGTLEDSAEVTIHKGKTLQCNPSQVRSIAYVSR